ncbi:unnamed protein product [Darwinula stevensoni]|uniref:Juvenile hormone acid methyltransferase n=1 Tax=Darwinula stevensoni TaxID=69355 RepID=A0A7R8XGT7_9CRUS|nr:unnamed protein product [Darwinula stevensoni]CAG0892856.1 unnamed protein product [Darwinula stevensoni]
MHNPKSYAKANALQRRDAKFALAMWKPLCWDVPGDVLDLGCGPGDVTVDLLRPSVPSLSLLFRMESDVLQDELKAGEYATRPKAGKAELRNESLLMEFHNALPFLPHSERKIVGVDQAREMVAYANDRWGKEARQELNVDFLHIPALAGPPDEDLDDLENLERPEPFPCYFAKAFSFFALHWAPDIPSLLRTLKIVRRSLVGGGEAKLVLLAHCPVFSVYKDLSSTLQGWEKFIGPYHDSPDPEEEFRGHLLEAGFLDPQVELINRHITYPNILFLSKAMEAVNPFLDLSEGPCSKEILDMCVDEIQKYTVKRSDGSLSGEYTLLIATASAPHHNGGR